MAESDDPIIRKTVSLTASFWRRIDDYQFQHRVKRDAEAIRRLLELGLEAAEARQQEVAKASRDEKPKKKAKGHPKDAAKAAESGLDDDAAGEARAPEVGEENDEAEK